MWTLAQEAWHLWLHWRLAFLHSFIWAQHRHMVPPAGRSANRANLNQWMPTEAGSSWTLLPELSQEEGALDLSLLVRTKLLPAA